MKAISLTVAAGGNRIGAGTADEPGRRFARRPAVGITKGGAAVKKVALAAATALVIFAPQLWAKPGYLAQSDRLAYHNEYQKSIDLLESSLPSATSDAERADIFWRLARGTFDIANAGESASGTGKPYLALYEESKTYADRAIALDPQNAKGYYWKAACVGKISQIRNLLRAFLEAGTVRDLLFEAGRLAPNDGEIWYVLAQLYSMIPGFPISFGDSAYAVSLGRKGLAARKAQVADGTEPSVPEDYYVQLGRELARRGWSALERQRRQPKEAQEYRSTADPVKKNFYFEGVVTIPKLSDRSEAIRIERGVVARLEALHNRDRTQNDDLRNARHDLAAWAR